MHLMTKKTHFKRSSTLIIWFIVLVMLPVYFVSFDATAADLEEILVTARKKAENIQDVPISIIAYDAAEIEAKHIDNFQDLANATPGLYVVTYNASEKLKLRLNGR